MGVFHIFLIVQIGTKWCKVSHVNFIILTKKVLRIAFSKLIQEWKISNCLQFSILIKMTFLCFKEYRFGNIHKVMSLRGKGQEFIHL